jgi:hypothetical protein
MTETQLTLYIDLQQGSRLDLEAAANAALAWSRLIKTVGQHVDPFITWKVELEGTRAGSIRLGSIIKLPDNAENRGMVKGAIFASVLFVFQSVGSWGIGKIMDWITGPDAPPEARSLSQEEMRLLAEEIVVLLENGVGRDDAAEVYHALEQDVDVTGVGVTSQRDRRPEVVIPRSSFPSRQVDAGKDEPKERVGIERTDLVVVKAVLANSPTRRWGFQSRLGAFGAPIRDAKFLSNLVAGRLNVPLRQGIIMDVDLETTERFEFGVWRPVERAVLAVHGITAPAAQPDLFSQFEPGAATDSDDEGDN